MNLSKQQLRRWGRVVAIVAASLAGLLLVGGLLAYTQREKLLKTALERGIRKAKRDYDLNVTVGTARFVGLTTVGVENVAVVPERRDTLVRLARAEVGVRLWPLLFGRVALARLQMQDGLVQVVKRDSLTNLDFILKRKKKDSTRTDRKTDYADVAEALADGLLSKVPDDLNIKRLTLRLRDDARNVVLAVDDARIDDEDVASTIRINQNEATWHVTGTAEPSNRQYDLALYAEGKPLELPYLQERFELKLQADTVRAALNDADRSGSEFRLAGRGSVTGLRVNHPALSPEDVVVRRAALDADLFVGENYVGIDSSSTAYLGDVSGHPFVKYTLTPDKVVDVAMHTDEMDAQAFFDAFPRGLFETLEGIKVSGQLRYDMALHFDTAQPDSVKFTSGLTPTDFKIQKLGNVDFRRVNQPFVYTPYENGKPVRNIMVGPENPDFTPLDQIAPDLRNAVLTSEDFNFFTHKGFNEKAFRVSIATNYKAGKFKRGASTVSMQLVKNLFLNRSKVVARKVEEILIVWLIENQRLIPKARMYEIYLNIIEWGRNVYGVGEAARYYFGTTPDNLTLGESIFLAFVVPAPKRALNYFLPDGSLQVQNVRGYFRIIGDFMVKRGLTAPDSGRYGFYSVRLREGLRRQVPMPDSLQIDSLGTDRTEGDGIDDFFQRLFNGKRDAEETKEDEPEVKEDPAKTSPAEPNVAPADTVKTRRQLRQERRERKRREREERNKQEEETVGSGQ